MIDLKADKELNLTFQKLIKMMDAPVEWNGMFFVKADGIRFLLWWGNLL